MLATPQIHYCLLLIICIFACVDMHGSEQNLMLRNSHGSLVILHRLFKNFKVIALYGIDKNATLRVTCRILPGELDLRKSSENLEIIINYDSCIILLVTCHNPLQYALDLQI